MSTAILTDPVIQYGFAGICVILIAILCWLARRLFEILEKNTSVISGNTSALEALLKEFEDSTRIYSDLRDRILSRPCLNMNDD